MCSKRFVNIRNKVSAHKWNHKCSIWSINDFRRIPYSFAKGICAKFMKTSDTRSRPGIQTKPERIKSISSLYTKP